MCTECYDGVLKLALPSFLRLGCSKDLVIYLGVISFSYYKLVISSYSENAGLQRNISTLVCTCIFEEVILTSQKLGGNNYVMVLLNLLMQTMICIQHHI
jgi:hypothetical protein